MANTAQGSLSPVRQFDPYTRPRLARWPIPGRLFQCLLQPVHVWLTAKLGADVPAETEAEGAAWAQRRAEREADHQQQAEERQRNRVSGAVSGTCGKWPILRGSSHFRV